MLEANHWQDGVEAVEVRQGIIVDQPKADIYHLCVC